MDARLTRVVVRLAIVLAALGTLAACGSTASDRTSPPAADACRALTEAQLTKATDDTEPIPCTRRHTAQTYLVGHLPGSAGTGYRSQAVAKYVFTACRAAFLRELDIDDALALRVDLSWAWFGPSRQGWEHGARWFRCDVVGGADGARRLRPIPANLRTLFHGLPPNAWLRCRSGADFTTATAVPCSQAHTWRAVSAIKIGGPDQPYPGDRFSEVRARDYCADAVIAWLDYPPTYAYGYTTFHQAEWEAGNRRALCWAGTTR